MAGKIITCRAAVWWDKDQECSIETIEVKAPKPGQIRVKMLATGICSTDISMSHGSFPALKFPAILGHEGVGEIESVGEGVARFKKGDMIIPLWSYNCGSCRWCKIGRRNYCQVSMAAMEGRNTGNFSRMKCKGKGLSQATGLGLFSEYVVIDEVAALKIKSHPNPEKLASFGCAIPTGYGAAIYTAKVFRGAVVAIYGLGAIGLSAALGCRDAGAERIIGINRSKEKFEIGKKFGCTECYSPRDFDKPMADVLKEKTGGLGVDFAFVCVGNMDVMNDAMQACSPGGSECIILGVNASSPQMTVNHLDLVSGKSLKGSWCGDCFPKNISEMVDKYVNGKLPTDHLISKVIALDQINEGFEQLKAGKTIRTVIKF